jgi:hypothetical protein
MHFMWVDATCHPSAASAFDINRDQCVIAAHVRYIFVPKFHFRARLPMVVAIAAKKQRFGTHIGRFDAVRALSLRRHSCSPGLLLGWYWWLSGQTFVRQNSHGRPA